MLVQTETMVICFCFGPDYTRYKWTPARRIYRVENLVSFLDNRGQIFYIPADNIIPYRESTASIYIRKLNDNSGLNLSNHRAYPLPS